MSEWQSIETFERPDVKPDDDPVFSKSGERVLLYFPDMKPSEIIGYCRGQPAYGGVYYEWCDDNGDQIELQSGAIEPSHWAPMLAPPKTFTEAKP